MNNAREIQIASPPRLIQYEYNDTSLIILAQEQHNETPRKAERDLAK